MIIKILPVGLKIEVLKSKMKVDQAITEDEAALYDRQIRLWGVEAQKK